MSIDFILFSQKADHVCNELLMIIQLKFYMLPIFQCDNFKNPQNNSKKHTSNELFWECNMEIFINFTDQSFLTCLGLFLVSKDF